MHKAFTLLELIIVIVILGILATLGFTQYTKIVEKGRIVEAVAHISTMRQNAIAYYMERGTFLNITAADLGIGTDSGSIPASCVSSNYFYYNSVYPAATSVELIAYRCTSGGKNPQWAGAQYAIYQVLDQYGSGELRCWDWGLSPPADTGWCKP